jgi:fucose permease
VIPEIPRAKEEMQISGRKLMRDPLVIAFGLALGFYAFSEFGVSLWLTNYLKAIYGYPESTGARYVGFFFLLFSVGRLLGGFVVQKVGTIRAVAGTLIIALGLMLSGLLLGEKFLIVVSIAGLFYSIVYPSLISKVGVVFPDSTAHAMGYVITIINVVLNGMNQVMGMLTDAIGPGLSIFLIPACLVAALAATAFIGSRTKEILK